jgi:hypothetical protein
MKIVLKRLTSWSYDNLPILIGGLFVALTFLLLSFINLLKTPSNIRETGYQMISSGGGSLKDVFSSPVFLPYNLLTWFASLFNLDPLLSARVVSIFIAGIGVAGFYLILKRWYTKRVMFFGLLLLITSGWHIFTSRFASPEASYLLISILVVIVIYLANYKLNDPLYLLALFLLLGGIYIPGLVWLIIPTVFMLRKELYNRFIKFNITYKLLSLALIIILILPLVLSNQNIFDNLYALMNLGNIRHLSSLPINIASILSSIFIYSPYSASNIYSLGRLPYLDIATATFVALGLWQHIVHLSLGRAKFLIGGFIISIILTSLNMLVSDTILIVFIYLFAIEGLRWILGKWMSIFPKNPVARGAGVCLISILVFTIAYYNINRYFIAWANSNSLHSNTIKNDIP